MENYRPSRNFLRELLEETPLVVGGRPQYARHVGVRVSADGRLAWLQGPIRAFRRLSRTVSQTTMDGFQMSRLVEARTGA